MLGSTNTYNSGKYSPALPLQHCNWQFFDFFEIGVNERIEKEIDFNHVVPSVFWSKIGGLVFSSVHHSWQLKFLKVKISFQAEFSCLLFKISFVAEFLSVQKLWLFTLVTLPSYRLSIKEKQGFNF